MMLGWLLIDVEADGVADGRKWRGAESPVDVQVFKEVRRAV